ncbi:hypothetical protein SELMODRAFT_414001 [Selaginella moellendorffii]|uniref:Kinesin-like protein n=1 Tax=Selaginella moellendorffii TaxID=88036 RepID=D8RRB2_SELML|nr:kinesin-like protein KIN-12B [Selaginella moellendorffii]EFJ25368.1 hypothetical protein SELMODRAFT_414001 [Selaginella moellendorffii]|eukprot:XP_002973708.1 kinesin-like protein KIN-12B [Selaginella moellendorffii]
MAFQARSSPVKHKIKRNAENVPPNTTPGRGGSNLCGESPLHCKSGVKAAVKGNFTPLHSSPGLPPRPPSSASKIPKRKLLWEQQNSEQPADSEKSSDTGVSVLVRVRPFNKKELLEQSSAIISKASTNSLSICDQHYTFDAVADEDSTQEEMFKLVGLPMVENCLAGFNSSIFAYGQTGSGKTYTMWGVVHDPTSGKPPSAERGVTPRVFETLFSRIKEEETKNAEKQLFFQCRCSFLEIYNEQIADLLEPRHKNLQVREDVKTGVYVDNLTEEYVSNMDDVSRLLLKGLGNRRIGATSLNTESSRSHTVFTCVLECRYKTLADGMSSVRRSRINLVDLAGSERQKQSGAAGERLKEAGNINKSLSQLGNVINILAEIAQSGKQRHVPYRDSRLTFLLQESLGGNAKLAMICAVSPADSCKSESTSTLRFAQRAKAIQNKAVVNEETTSDSNLLREQIRQLKDELKRMKSKEKQQGVDGPYSSACNARRSYNLLRLSLALPMTVPATVDSDSDEEMEIDENAVEGRENSVESIKENTVDDSRENDHNATPEKHDEQMPEYFALAQQRDPDKADDNQARRREVEELQDALEVAMTGHARLLEQYAELQEKHVALVAKQRRIREGVTDVRQMAMRAGASSSQLKWLESQAAQIVALNLEREQEREAANEEIEFLQSQLRDTAEAVQAAGELLVRLKEAEEAAAIANDAAALAEQDADRMYREMEKLKRRHATEMATLQQRLLESRLQRAAPCPMCVMAERVKFQFTDVDPDTAAAAMEAEQDAAALEQELAQYKNYTPMEAIDEDEDEELVAESDQQGQGEELYAEDLWREEDHRDDAALEQEEERYEESSTPQEGEKIAAGNDPCGQGEEEDSSRDYYEHHRQDDGFEDEIHDDLYDGSEDRCNF